MNRLTFYNKSGEPCYKTMEYVSFYQKEISVVISGTDVARKLAAYEDAEEQGLLARVPETGIADLSDGYHTFNELYYHRAILFSVICHCFPERAWKTKRHDDGTMYDGMFIVGFDTGFGQATYHYDIDPYWNDFDVKELECAPKWDGHTPAQAAMRLYMFGEQALSRKGEEKP